MPRQPKLSDTPRKCIYCGRKFTPLIQRCYGKSQQLTCGTKECRNKQKNDWRKGAIIPREKTELQARSRLMGTAIAERLLIEANEDYRAKLKATKPTVKQILRRARWNPYSPEHEARMRENADAIGR